MNKINNLIIFVDLFNLLLDIYIYIVFASL